MAVVIVVTLAGALGGVVSMIIKRHGDQKKLPLGPYLGIASLLTLLARPLLPAAQFPFH